MQSQDGFLLFYMYYTMVGMNLIWNIYSHVFFIWIAQICYFNSTIGKTKERKDPKSIQL